MWINIITVVITKFQGIFFSNHYFLHTFVDLSQWYAACNNYGASVKYFHLRGRVKLPLPVPLMLLLLLISQHQVKQRFCIEGLLGIFGVGFGWLGFFPVGSTSTSSVKLQKWNSSSILSILLSHCHQTGEKTTTGKTTSSRSALGCCDRYLRCG